MSQAEELLNGMSEEVPVHTHPVPDTDTYFVIDPITKQIENTNRRNTVIMQYTHNSERLTFELPRYIDGHDMLECTSVTVNANNIEVVESEEVEPRVNPDAPDITDLRIHPNDPEKAICSWLISRNSTQLAGILSFHIEFKCVDSNGNVVYEWSTDNYDEIEVRARKKNGEAAVVEHTDLLEQWRTRIFGAGDSVLANIAAEGEAQVAAVKAESETQQEAVELKGAQTLDSIPEDYTEVDAMADEAVRTKGDAIICEAAGESIVLKDSSSDHIRGLKLFGKSSQVTTKGYQLFDASTLSSISMAGVTFANNGDGSYTIAGTGVHDGNFTASAWLNHEEFVKLFKAGPVYLSSTKTRPYFTVYAVDTSANTRAFTLTHVMPEAVITQEMLDNESIILYYAFSGSTGEEIIPGTIKPMLYQDGDGTWEPFSSGYASPSPNWSQEIVSIGDAGSMSLQVNGKNLLEVNGKSETINGVTFTINENGCVLVNGTATANAYHVIRNKVPLIADEKYTLTGCPVGGSMRTYLMYYHNNVTGEDFYDEGSGVTFPATLDSSNIVIVVYKGTTVNSLTFYPMIRQASVIDATFEPYKPGQSIAIPRILPGVPVTSGGNYTDENGQQWICDEIDFERGVYVKRIEQYVYDGSEDENWKNGYSSNGKNNRFELILMGVPVAHEVCESNNAAFVAKNAYCSHFDYQRTSTRPDVNNFRISKSVTAVQDWWYMLFTPDTTIIPLEDLEAWKTYLAENPMTIMVPLNTPIETPLTAEEITAFKALRTNYPSTTILNDAGAWMSVKYNADTKTYVENPKVLKLVDSSTGVVYELKIVDGNITVTPV